LESTAAHCAKISLADVCLFDMAAQVVLVSIATCTLLTSIVVAMLLALVSIPDYLRLKYLLAAAATELLACIGLVLEFLVLDEVCL
jgi:hypothetical protein